MSNNSFHQVSQLFPNIEEKYYKKLDKYTPHLRQLAHEMVIFINHLENKTPALKALQESCLQLESVPAKYLYKSLEAVKNSLEKVEFIKIDTTLSAKNQDDFIGFFVIQNNFNMEINELVKQAVQIAG